MTITPRTVFPADGGNTRYELETALAASRAECERLREALKRITRHNTAGMSEQMQDDVRDARMLVGI